MCRRQSRFEPTQVHGRPSGSGQVAHHVVYAQRLVLANFLASLVALHCGLISVANDKPVIIIVDWVVVTACTSAGLAVMSMPSRGACTVWVAQG